MSPTTKSCFDAIGATLEQDGYKCYAEFEMERDKAKLRYYTPANGKDKSIDTGPPWSNSFSVPGQTDDEGICYRNCLDYTNFVCESFEYDLNTRECILYGGTA